MSAVEVMAQIKALSAPERECVFCLLLQDKELRADLLDSITIEQRRDEPGRPLVDVLNDLGIGE